MIVAVTLLISRGQESSTVTDIDGNVYHTVKIGNQVWTVDNMHVTKYNDGSPIMLATDIITWKTAGDQKIGAYCYYNFGTSEYSIKKYGAYYNWYAIDTTKLAPTGWHVPDSADWAILKNYLIANGYNWDGTTDGNKAAKSLAAKTDWLTVKKRGAIGNDLNKNNKSGFSALGGGYCHSDGEFHYLDKIGYWWSTTSGGYFKIEAYVFILATTRAGLRIIGRHPKSHGISVRLVKD